jgi:spermidine synthase
MAASSQPAALRGGSSGAWFGVVLLFVASGAAALIYEVAWFHLLRLVIGGSWVSLGILLGSFMGGMCLGSLLLPWLVPARFHPLRVYAALELGIGVLGGTLPWWLPKLSDWYLSVASGSFVGATSLTGIAARAVVAAVAILPATMLMGATLPAVARWVKGTPEGLARLGVFYGANTFGAVIGCLAAGFALLPLTDAAFTCHVAAAINAAIAIAAFGLAAITPYERPDVTATVKNENAAANASAVVCVVIAISGFAALGAEVAWTRLLALLFGATVYTFAIILAVFLAGIGLGSTLAARWVTRTTRPLFWLAVTQLAVAVCGPYVNFVVTRVIPYWSRPSVEVTEDIYWMFAFDTLRTAVAVLPAAFCWGASFPLALAAAGRGLGDTGRLVGQVYAANTLGAILGSIVTTAVIVPAIGLQHTQQLLVMASGVAAAIAFRAAGSLDTAAGAAAPRGHFAALVIAVAAALLVVVPPSGMFGRSMYPGLWAEAYDDLFKKDGRSATVAVQQHQHSNFRAICIGGKIEASNLTVDLRCQRLLGHLPALIHPAPKKVLIVGLGTGTTAGCFVLHPEVESIKICEIEPVVAEASGRFFAVENNRVLEDERTTIVYDDARHFLATTDEKFDVITSDPINSWIHGAAALYSVEHFEECKKHLNPGGIVVQWIPLYEKDLATAKCELGTFLHAFPDAMLWTSWRPSDGTDYRHDIIAIGQLDSPQTDKPNKLDLAAIDARINANKQLLAKLDEVNLGTIPGLMAQFAGEGQRLRPWIGDAELNRDASLRLEYLAGLAIWMVQAHEIFDEIAAFRRYPADNLENDEKYEADIRQRLNLPAADAASTGPSKQP